MIEVARGTRGARASSADSGSIDPVGAARGDTGGVGFNPFRQQRRSSADYLVVVAAMAVIVAMVAWAFLG